MGLFSEVAQAFENAAGRGSRAFDAVACRPEWPFMKQRATFPSKVQQQNPTASDFLVASNLHLNVKQPTACRTLQHSTS